jgi:hypothetical protein
MRYLPILQSLRGRKLRRGPRNRLLYPIKMTIKYIISHLTSVWSSKCHETEQDATGAPSLAEGQNCKISRVVMSYRTHSDIFPRPVDALSAHPTEFAQVQTS